MKEDITQLKQALIAMVILDIIMTEENESWLRLTSSYFEQDTLTVMIDNGSGDHMAVFISPGGAVIKGFDHESPLSPYGDAEDQYISTIYRGFPDSLPEPPEKEEVTFCMWRESGDFSWNENPNPLSDGGKDFLLGYIFYSAAEWISWAKEYFEQDSILESAVEQVYQTLSADREVIAAINPHRDAEAALSEIGKLQFS